MFLVSVDGLEVAGFRHLWSFFRLAHAVRKEAMNAEGNISVDLFRQGRVFFVVSVWHSPAEMHNFARSGMHGELMREGTALIESSVNIHYQSTTLPTRDGAFAMWVQQKA
jgi:heme-degrading monooxygenase HmoA